MTLRKVNQFTTTDPSQLGRQLNDLEDNCGQELQRLDLAKLNVPEVVTVRPPSGNGRIGQLIRADVSTADVVLNLPKPTPSDAGQCLLVAVISPSHTITLAPTNGALINGSATLSTSGAIKLLLVATDGVDYWVNL